VTFQRPDDRGDAWEGTLGETVYLVDDEPPVLKALTRLLKSYGYMTRSFLSAQDFLAAYDFTTPGCILLDLQLPGMNGLELQKVLLDRGSILSIIFLSGQADVPSSVAAMKKGAVDFLTKPIDAKSLVTAVEAALERNRKDRASATQRDEMQHRCETLSPRERQVIDGVVGGLLNKQIAARLGITEKTVKVHRARAMSKLGCRSAVEMVHLVNNAPEAFTPLQRA
jgi:RNA polymerase sigma factor (sigma-70 family)